ncbi:MAG: cytochrome c biogenesis protein ResB [Christensenellales bacterium]
MKKTLKFLQSMRFGMLLLVLILLISLVGSFIPQGNESAYYQERYGELAKVLLVLKLDNVFFSWYFIALTFLLCVNLLFCSVLRLGKVSKAYRMMPESVSALALSPTEVSQETLLSFLKANRFKLLKTNSGKVYGRGRMGHYGTFVVHLALLLLLVSAAGAIYLSTMTDVSLRVGEQTTLDDGTVVELAAFRSANEAGEVVYESDLSVRYPDGGEEQKQVTVNYPASISGQKIFQMGYGIEGLLTIDHQGKKDSLALSNEDAGSFLTVDGKSGIVFQGLFPDYVETDSGVNLLRSSKLGYPNPVYAVVRIENGQHENSVALPGTTAMVGDVIYTFEKPVNISTLRLKSYPASLFSLLYFSFVLLIAGIWLAFFQIPVYIHVGEEGYAMRSAKPVPELEKALKALAENRQV